MPEAAAGGDAGPYPRRAYAGLVIGVLMLVTLSSQLDRNLTALLVQPIRRDLGLSDTQVSLVHGAAFALFYTIMGLPFGRLVDRTNRRNLIAIGIVAWSAMTLLCGIAGGFWSLFLARMGVGLGEACLAPAAYSLIADYVEPRRRGRALAIYWSALAIGQGGSLLMGGAVLAVIPQDLALHAPGIGVLHPWRMVFLAAGGLGVLLAPLLLAVREVPRRSEAASHSAHEASSIRAFLAHLHRNGSAFALVYACYGFVGILGMSMAAWTPTLLVREYGLGLPRVGLIIGLATIVGGFAGAGLSGVLSDACVARGAPGGRFFVPVVSWLAMLPILVVWATAPSLGVTVVTIALFTAASALAASSAPAAVQDLTPNHMRGQAVALYLLVAGLAGLALGPTAVALVTDYVYRDPAALRLSLVTVGVPGVLLGLAASLAGLRPYARARSALLAGAASQADPSCACAA